MNIKKIAVGVVVLFSIFFISNVHAATYTWTKTLKHGMKDEEVRTLQKFLNMYPSWQVATTGPGSPGNETINFATLTKEAVKRF